MDLDGDGYLSMYELEYFYEEQLQRMEQLGIETLPFEDCLCQVRKLIHSSKDKFRTLGRDSPTIKLCYFSFLLVTFQLKTLLEEKTVNFSPGPHFVIKSIVIRY